jgi:hypothetical protein
VWVSAPASPPTAADQRIHYAGRDSSSVRAARVRSCLRIITQASAQPATGVRAGPDAGSGGGRRRPSALCPRPDGLVQDAYAVKT